MANVSRNISSHNYEEAHDQPQHLSNTLVNERMAYPFHPPYSVQNIQPGIFPPYLGGPYPFVPQIMSHGHHLMIPSPQSSTSPSTSVVPPEEPSVQETTPGPVSNFYFLFYIHKMISFIRFLVSFDFVRFSFD